MISRSAVARSVATSRSTVAFSLGHLVRGRGAQLLGLAVGVGAQRVGLAAGLHPDLGGLALGHGAAGCSASRSADAFIAAASARALSVISRAIRN